MFIVIIAFLKYRTGAELSSDLFENAVRTAHQQILNQKSNIDYTCVLIREG